MARRKKSWPKKPQAIMGPGVEDAKSVFEQLRLQGEVDSRTDVDVTTFPTAKEILAELRYSFDKTEWAAVVTKDNDEVGSPCFRLWYQRGDRFQKSGVFPDGTKLAAYIRAQAAESFKGAVPCIDTLDRLKFKTAASVVPDCYRTHARTAKCLACPYKDECFEGLNPSSKESRLEWIVVHEPGPDEQMQEPEEVFLQRLQGKVEDKWGPRVEGEKPDLVVLDEAREHAEGLKCPDCDGTGEVLGTGTGFSGEASWVQCRACGGTGFRHPGGG